MSDLICPYCHRVEQEHDYRKVGSDCHDVLYHLPDGKHFMRCEGKFVRLEDFKETNFESFSKKYYQVIQDLFDNEFKPAIIKEMKRLKIKKVESVMGVTFYTLNNGTVLDDDEFEESTEARRMFVKKYIKPFEDNPFYSSIDYNIDLTK